MIKVKDFWQKLCVDLNYRFYVGVPIPEFKLLHTSMDPDNMHYIPTISETIGVGLVTGAFFSGYKGVVLMSSQGFDFLKIHNKQFFDIPLLYIVEDTYNPFKLKQFQLLDDLSILEQLDNEMYSVNSQPCILVIKEGILV